ncbi:hypothetical protein FB451DRAFT_1133854 [Mycena latifolia]|nr:hypothetical protein FB451DRAFT_1133854 [Mycena latifolia]
MQRHTPWTKTSSSLPSDRIRPSPPPAQPAAKNTKNKGKAPAAEPPKSKAVRTLEGLRSALVAVDEGKMEKDPKGGCFCQARMHQLSSYAPLCRTCGLVLCTLNGPAHACPHCDSALLTATQRVALISRLEQELTEILAQEAAERERKAEEARRAVGAFPTLGKPSAPLQAMVQQQPQTRTVLSLNSKTKKVTVSAFTTPAHSSSSSAAPSRPATPEPERVAGPPASVPCAPAAALDKGRPWRDAAGGGAVYVAAPNLDGDGDEVKKKRRRNRGKAKENEVAEVGGQVGAEGSATVVD